MKKKKKKEFTLEKKKGKNSDFFADGVVLYIENSQKTTRKLLEIINEVCIIVRYKINTQKSLALHFCTLKTKDWKEKLKTQSHFPLYQK